MNKKLTKLFIITVTFTLPFFILTKAQPQTDWIEMDSQSKSNLLGISGDSPTDIFAVGANGTARQYDAEAKEYVWKEIPALRDDRQLKGINLNAVWGGSERNVFVAGDQGTIKFGYKGVHWSTMKTPSNENGEKENLYGIWGSSLNDVFAVGAKGTILHYDGDGDNKGSKDDIWEKMSTPLKDPKPNLNAIWGNSPRNVFAAGEGGIILHYNGKKWSVLVKADKQNSTLNAIWGGAYDVFAVGEAGTILHYKDKKWTPIKNPDKNNNNLHGIWGNSPGNVFAVGEGGTILHKKDEKWSLLEPLPDFMKNQSFRAVWTTSNPHVFIIGDGGIISGGKYQGAYWFGGYVYKLKDGTDLGGVTVLATNCASPNPSRVTDSSGNYDDIACTSGSPTLQFSKSGYKTETIPVTLRLHSRIGNNTYLIYNNDVNIISGVVSKLCESYYYCPIEGIKVNLYEDMGNCTFPSTPDRWTSTDAKGRYSFSDLNNVIYKIEPEETNCSFSTSYVSIPQNSPPKAFDFVGQETGTGKCTCTSACP